MRLGGQAEFRQNVADLGVAGVVDFRSEVDALFDSYDEDGGGELDLQELKVSQHLRLCSVALALAAPGCLLRAARLDCRTAVFQPTLKRLIEAAQAANVTIKQLEKDVADLRKSATKQQKAHAKAKADEEAASRAQVAEKARAAEEQAAAEAERKRLAKEAKEAKAAAKAAEQAEYDAKIAARRLGAK